MCVLTTDSGCPGLRKNRMLVYVPLPLSCSNYIELISEGGQAGRQAGRQASIQAVNTKCRTCVGKKEHQHESTVYFPHLISRKQYGCAFISAHPLPPCQRGFGPACSVSLLETAESKGPSELVLSMRSSMFLFSPLGMKNSSKSQTATLSATPFEK